jgi:hypothetical protein
MATEKNISVEQAYNICLFFYEALWASIEPKLVIVSEDSSVCHMLFFTDVCLGFECSAIWMEAVFRIKKIPKIEQRKGEPLTVDDSFLCTVEFCRLCTELYNWDLRYILNVLASMRARPQNHHFEWTTWQESVDRSFKYPNYWDLNWNDELDRR